MHVLVYRRAGRLPRGQSRLFCSVPVFGTGQGATENSLVGWNNGLVVENNSGYLNPTTRLTAGAQPGGVTKVVVGKHGCRVAWTSTVLSPSVVPKLARGNGKLYLYSPHPLAPGIDEWRLTVARLADRADRRARSRPVAVRHTTTPGHRSRSARR